MKIYSAQSQYLAMHLVCYGCVYATAAIGRAAPSVYASVRLLENSAACRYHTAAPTVYLRGTSPDE